MTTNFYVEYYGKQLDQNEVLQQAKDNWVAAGNKASSLKSINVYIKPEENKAYYVINNADTGSFDI